MSQDNFSKIESKTQLINLDKNDRHFGVYIFTISFIFHLIILFLPSAYLSTLFEFQKNNIGLRYGDSKRIRIIRKPVEGVQEKNKTQPVLSLEKLQERVDAKKIDINANTLPETMTLHRNKDPSARMPSILAHKVQGKDVSVPKGMKLSDNKNNFLEDTDFDVGVEIPKGTEVDQINRSEEVLFSFRKRIFDQFINRIFYTFSTQESLYSINSYPWTYKRQTVRAKLIYNSDGYVEKITPLLKADNAKLQSFFDSIVQGMTMLPNPPKIALDENGKMTIYISIIVE